MEPIFGKSPATQKLLDLVEKVSESDVSVLVSGPSGSGKEIIAQKIHASSSRKEGKFVAVNCGAIPRELLESELFGHKKGAFTGAISDRIGKIVAAHRGTLFLDEIGDMPMDMQVKLLRVLQERVVDPVGSNSSVPVDVRIISATHRSIEKEVEEDHFRADLFFRLNVVPIQMPSLSDRAEEIPTFVEYFSELYKQKEKKINLNPKFIQQLSQYEWPGNIRELSNFIHRLSVLYPGEDLSLGKIEVSMLPPGLQEVIPDETINVEREANELETIVMAARGIEPIGTEEFSLKETLNRIEQEMISKTLSEVNGNVSVCAKLLKVQRTTLIDRIKKYQIS
ncbi:MAG: sigma-54-dependent Fis family transcriptional regulator [Gammaproteobacteria bacterium]|nr:sigma-54-dependent Fis family transcriptional regulator [Gammaproteobacteria bacterium]